MNLTNTKDYMIVNMDKVVSLATNKPMGCVKTYIYTDGQIVGIEPFDSKKNPQL